MITYPTIRSRCKSIRLVLIAFSCLLLLLSQRAYPAWTILNPQPTAGDIIDIEFVDDSNGFLVTDGGILMKTTDGGENWTNLNNPNADTGVWDIDFINPNWGWVLCGNDPDNRGVQFIDYTRDAGDNWETYSVGSDETPATLNCLEFFDGLNGWAGGVTSLDGNLRYVIFRFIDGDTWEPIILPEGRGGTSLNEIFFLNRNFGWVVGDNGYTAYTTDGGREWLLSDPVTDDHLYGVHFSGPMDGWAVGGGFERGVILRSTDAGESWNVQRGNPIPTRLRAVHAYDTRSAIAISEGMEFNMAMVPAMIFSTSDAENWSLSSSIYGPVLQCMSNIERNVWIGGSNGYIAASANGIDWHRLSEFFGGGDFYDIWVLNRFSYVGGDQGALYRTINSGQRWDGIETGSDWRIMNLHFTSPFEGYITGANSTELFTENMGESWEEVEISGVDVNLITFTDEFGYATHGQSVAVTRDNGQNWESSEVIRGEIPASALSVPTRDIAYVASAGDTLRRSFNGGVSWEPVHGLMGESFGVSFVDANTGWAIAPTRGQGIRLFKTTDGGESWDSGYRFELAPGGVLFADENNGWIWENPGRVLHTDNGGQTWEDSNLRVNRIIRSLTAESSDRLWICGEDGLIAIWNRFELSTPVFTPQTPTGFTITPLYPNPTNSAVNMSISITRPGDYNIKLLDLTGRTLKNSQMSFSSGGTYPISVHLNGMAAGVYWVGVGDGELNLTRKVVLVR